MVCKRFENEKGDRQWNMCAPRHDTNNVQGKKQAVKQQTTQSKMKNKKKEKSS